MKKILSIILTVVFLCSMSIGVFADQVSGDAVVATALTRDQTTTVTAASDGSWSINLGVFIERQGTNQKSDIYDNGIVDGTITHSSGVTLSKSTWSVSATLDATYSTEDTVNASGIATVTQDYTVIFTADSDESGITRASDTVTIHVIVPTVALSISAPTNMSDVEATDVRTPVNIGTATSAGGTLPVNITNDAPATFPLGLTTVTWTATDAIGRTVTATQTITVVDTTHPVFTVLPTAKTVEATAVNTPKSAIDFGTVVATDIFGATVTNNAPTTFPLGPTTVIWTATDGNGLTTTVDQVVTIVDTTRPVFTELPTAKTVEATAVNTPNSAIDFGTVEATDIFGATVTNDAPTTFPLGPTTVIWTATDGNGLTRTATQVITIVDTTHPVFTFVPGAAQIKATGINTPVSAAQLGTATAYDIFGVTITNDAPATFPIGTTTVTWTATDGNGLTRTATQDVIVTYNFTGFFQPIDMGANVVNTVKAGSAVPVKFSLNGNMGLDIFAAGYPKVVDAKFAISANYDEVEAIVTATNSGLSYDSASKTYTYVWKTDKSWTSASKQLVIKLKDGTICTANFLFK